MKSSQCSRELKRTWWRRYYYRHKIELLRRNKEWRNKDLEGFRRSMRQYRARNSTHFLERDRQYYQEHKEIILEHKRESQRIKARIRYWKEKGDVIKHAKACKDWDEYVERKKAGPPPPPPKRSSISPSVKTRIDREEAERKIRLYQKKHGHPITDRETNLIKWLRINKKYDKWRRDP